MSFLGLGQAGQCWGQDLLTASQQLSSMAFQAVKPLVWEEARAGQYAHSQQGRGSRAGCGAWACAGWGLVKTLPLSGIVWSAEGELLYFSQSSPSVPTVCEERDEKTELLRKVEDIWLRCFVKHMAFGLGEEELLC